MLFVLVTSQRFLVWRHLDYWQGRVGSGNLRVKNPDPVPYLLYTGYAYGLQRIFAHIPSTCWHDMSHVTCDSTVAQYTHVFLWVGGLITSLIDIVRAATSRSTNRSICSGAAGTNHTGCGKKCCQPADNDTLYRRNRFTAEESLSYYQLSTQCITMAEN